MKWELGSIYKTASGDCVRLSEVDYETKILLGEGTLGIGGWDTGEGLPLTTIAHEYGRLEQLQRPTTLGALKHG